MNLFAANPLKKLLFTLAKRAKYDTEQRFGDAEIGVTPLQYGVLSCIESSPNTLMELSQTFRMRPPSLVPVVDFLEKKKYIKKTEDAKDRRKTNLAITPIGSTLLKSFQYDDAQDAVNTAFAKLSSARQKQLLTLLKELTDNLHN